MRRIPALIAVAVLLAFAGSASAAFDPAYEQSNFSKTRERFQHDYGTNAEFQAKLRQESVESEADMFGIIAADPERASMLGNLCARHNDGCAGDVRFYDWPTASPDNVRRGPVLWTSHSGATISGHVWATKSGPAKRPAVVITNGSVQAPEELYWAFASTLAKNGYVVLTWDPQTQGRSDGADQNIYPQNPSAFTEGTRVALDFMLSTPGDPFKPRPFGSTYDPTDTETPEDLGSAKQTARVASGKNAAFNPLHDLIDPSRIGIAGHSLGASAVSTAASQDQRVKAVVAWDNLRADAANGKAATPRVPALGMGADYGLTPNPNTSEPDKNSRNTGSKEFSKRSIDTMQVNIRGGTHYEFSFIPNPGFGATLRGYDKTAWYTLAWMEKYVKGDEAMGDRMLLTDRWQRDKAEADVDPTKDGNTFSQYLLSRIDLNAGGSRVTCEDLRKGCGVLKDDGLGGFCAAASGFSPSCAKPGDAAVLNGALRGGACVTSAKAPKRVKRGKRFRVKLKLAQDTRITASVRKAKRSKARKSASKRSLKAGSRVLRLKAPKRAGRYRLSLTGRCAGGKQVRRITLRVR